MYKKFIIILYVIFGIINVFTGCSISNIAAKIEYADKDKYEINQTVESFEIEIGGELFSSCPPNKEIYLYWQPVSFNVKSVIGISDFNGVTLIYNTNTPWCYMLNNVNSEQSLNVPYEELVYNTELDPALFTISDYTPDENYPDRNVYVDTEILSEYDISGYSYGTSSSSGLQKDKDAEDYILSRMTYDKKYVDELKNRLTDPSIIKNGIVLSEHRDENGDEISPIFATKLFIASDDEELKNLYMIKDVYMLPEFGNNMYFIAREYENNTYYVDVTDLIEQVKK